MSVMTLLTEVSPAGMVVVSDLYKEMVYGISDGVTAVLVNNSKAVGLAVGKTRL